MLEETALLIAVSAVFRRVGLDSRLRGNDSMGTGRIVSTVCACVSIALIPTLSRAAGEGAENV